MVHYNNLKATGHRNWGKSFELFQNNDHQRECLENPQKLAIYK